MSERQYTVTLVRSSIQPCYRVFLPEHSTQVGVVLKRGSDQLWAWALGALGSEWSEAGHRTRRAAVMAMFKQAALLREADAWWKAHGDSVKAEKVGLDVALQRLAEIEGAPS